MSVYYAATAILGLSGLILIAVAREIPGLWWIPLWVATLAPAMWAYVQTLRRDPWNAAMFTLMSALCPGVFVWPASLMMDSGPALARAGIVLLVVAACTFAYLLWRRFGRERAPDFLEGDDVYEIDGIAMRWIGAFRGHPDNYVMVDVELQNAYDDVVSCELRLVPIHDAARNVIPATAHLRLQPGEYGLARIGVQLSADAAGSYRLRVVARGRRSRFLPGRFRLRPKQTLTVGAVQVMSVLAALAVEFREYEACSIGVVATPDAPVLDESFVDVHWESRWLPES